MSLDSFTDQISIATKRFVRENPQILDNVFHQDPALKYIKDNCLEVVSGGRNLGGNFIYDGLIGAAYNVGETFDISDKQIDAQLQWDWKFSGVNVTYQKEEHQVINKGDNAVYRTVEMKLKAAYLTLGQQLAAQLWLNGSRAGYTKLMSGFAEALNDGSTASWDGQTYSTYGRLTRANYNGAINSVPVNVAGSIEYDTLETNFTKASFGEGEFKPNVGITTPLGLSYIKNKFQAQQRANDTTSGDFGFDTFRFNATPIMASRLVPGTEISGTSMKVVSDYLIKSSQGTGSALTGYPTVTAETFWWMNLRKDYVTLYVTDDEEFGFGNTGWKPAQNGNALACQVLFAGALAVYGPRYHKQLFGITG